VIVDALTAQLETEHHLMSERGPAAAQQRRRARSYATTIEAFMAALGLEGQ
jgi:dsRNA-specific ribonuclease